MICEHEHLPPVLSDVVGTEGCQSRPRFETARFQLMYCTHLIFDPSL